MTAPLSEFQRVLHTLDKKHATMKMLAAEIEALEELLAALERTQELEVNKDGTGPAGHSGN